MDMIDVEADSRVKQTWILGMPDASQLLGLWL
jgi:hypothetical protein